MFISATFSLQNVSCFHSLFFQNYTSHSPPGDEFRRVNALIQHQNNSSWCPGAIDRHNGRRQQRQQLNQNPINPSEYVCQQVYNPPVLPSEIEFQSDEPKSSLQEAPHTREKRKWSSSLAAAACRSSKRRRSVRSPVPVPEPPPPIAARDVDDVNFDPELTDFAGEMERLKLGQPFPPNLLIECNSTCPPLENSSLAVHAPLPLPNASNRKDYPRTTTTTIMGCKLNSEIGKVYNFPMEEQQRQFSNQFLPADKVLAKIHFECYQAGSPLYLPDRIIGILQEANWTYAGFHLGSPYITKRESLLKRIEKTVGATHRIYCVDLGAHLQGNAFTRKGNLKGNLTSCTSFDIIWTAIDDWPGLFLESPSFLKVMSQTSPDYGPSISTTDSPFLNSRCDI
ncbi:unnamed protein product [Cylindrotheca closterium]|uniref:Uncharacterized protein n=1 Tax=Cylindrotheca closterium TaxID=2856 RepID=A0AAD2FJ14_9STRA|nr:unnamed protein product [Cylindrotheca closterium]